MCAMCPSMRDWIWVPYMKPLPTKKFARVLKIG